MANLIQKKLEQELSQKEAEERRDAILKRMLNTPPKPKKGKGGGKQTPMKDRGRG